MTRAAPIIIAIDQGTSSTKGVVLSEGGEVLSRASADLASRNPRLGWVEQDPTELLAGVRRVLQHMKTDRPVAGIGLSTQRESAMAWDTETGEPLSALIGWQDRRTAPEAAAFDASAAATVQRISGLPLDPMFSALKFGWILDQIDPDRRRSSAGRITLGTVDAWLVFRLTGERRIERGNASRTQLLDVSTGEWSEDLLEAFRVPRAALPDIAASDDAAGIVDGLAPVCAVLGDSHAALFGHGCRRPGTVKVTYGTGSSVMGLTEGVRIEGIADTIAWDIDGVTARAFEGNILSTGATVAWLASILGSDAETLASLACSSEDGGVDLVPAFAGLAAPWWDPSATGTVSGLTLGTTAGQLARAALESTVLQVEDVLGVAERAVGGEGIGTIRVDGGASQNRWLMQRQADLSGRTVALPDRNALSVLGAAWLAGVTRGLWSMETPPWEENATVFQPGEDGAARLRRLGRWHDAVARARLQPDRDHR